MNRICGYNVTFSTNPTEQIMKWLEKLVYRMERMIAPVAVPNLALVIIVGQFICYMAAQANPELYGQFILTGAQVMDGEVWRLFTFVFAFPPDSMILFALIAWLFFHFLASLLEHAWGTAKFNLYLLIGYIAAVIAAFIYPTIQATPLVMASSVFLAAAAIHPHLVIRIMFILPVEIRWLAYLNWIGIVYMLIVGDMALRTITLAGVINYLMFLGPMYVQRMQNYKRRAEWNEKVAVQKSKPRHTCTVCGIDSNQNPDMDFRYCSQCEGAQAYCEQHLRDHEHIVGREAD
ncbi:MAG: hypothetical protein KDB27_18590 [Planctomycetales bacterium]|nr:hypothetical protein [Planctomycetales bacterium]